MSTLFIESIDNLVLLCPSCHRKVDKVPEHFPAHDLFDKKQQRANAVALIGGTPLFSDRRNARKAVCALLAKSRSLFKIYGPDPATGFLQSQESAASWSEVVLREIVPNHELVCAIVEVNSGLATSTDVEAAAALAAHARDLADKHANTEPLTRAASQFPQQVEGIFEDRESAE